MILPVYPAAFFVIFGLILTWRFVTLPDPIGPQMQDDIDPRNVARQIDLERSPVERIVAPVLDRLRARVRRVTPVSRIQALDKKLVLAGMGDSRWTAESLLAAKMVMTVIGGLMAAALLSKGLSTGNLMKAGLAFGVFYLVPETLLTRKVDDRAKRMQNDLPDFVDQITVSVEAGLGFDQAMQRAGEEGKGPLADELVRVVNDLQIGMSRDEALEALLERTQVPDLRQFILAVKQASRYGLPIARVLRVQSAEMREKRRARAETKAMQIPVKITFPLVFFILPALFLVILGPAAISITSNGV